MGHPAGENDEVFVRGESSDRVEDLLRGARMAESPSLPENETVEPLPEEVKHFLEANIDSVDQLEILRVLGEDPHREWLAADLAREAQTAPQTIGSHLTLLQARGLLVLQTREGNQFCRYGPSGPELAERVGLLLQVYRERPVTMIKLVYAAARDPLRTFADAFRLKKES